MRTQDQRTQDQLVSEQFGSVAEAYFTSPVHAHGRDLQELAMHVRQRPDSSILDLGCGAGHASFAVAPHAKKVTAYDLSEPMLAVVTRAARERGLHNIEVRQGGTEALPFADASFDIVCTRYSAHHWSQLEQALAEIHRVLKPGGQCLVIDIVAPAATVADTYLQTIEVLRDASHIRDYTLAEWSGRLQKAGLCEVGRQSWKLQLDFESWVQRMRTPAERVRAIRSLWDVAPQEVVSWFRLEKDYSFTVDAALIEAVKS